MHTVLRLFSYVKKNWKLFALGNLLLFISVGLRLYLPRVGKYIIDDVITEHMGELNFPVQMLVNSLLIYAVVGALAAVINYFAGACLTKSANYFTESLRNEVYDHIHNMPVSYFDQVPAGTIVSRITNDTETIRTSFYMNVFGGTLMATVTIIGIYIALLGVSVPIALGMLIVLPGLALFKKAYQTRATDAQAEIREIHGEVNGQLNEISKNIQLTQSYGREEQVKQKFVNLTGRKLDAQKRFTKFDWMMFSIPECIFRFLMFAAVTWLAYGHLNVNLPVTAGFVYLVVEYMAAFFSPVNTILDVMATIIRSIVAAERVFVVLDTPTEANGEEILEDVLGKIEADHVSFSYIEGQEVLHDVSFEALPGQSVAIVGPTGSGKSSLLNLLFRFYDPQQGQVLIDGREITPYNRSSLRSHMGIVLQDPFLIEDSIYQNISLGNPAITREMATDALMKVGGKSILNQYAEGMDHEITERGKNLSTGQRQLISFARALAYNPKILILDEATASIDTETEQIIQEAMEVVKQGRTTIIIAHRLSTIRDCDQIYVLKDGHVVERGRHQELLSLGGEYKSMLHQH